jgi:hypothetical protein
MSFSHKSHGDEKDTNIIFETTVLDISLAELNLYIQYRLGGKLEYNGKINAQLLENEQGDIIYIRRKKDGTIIVEHKKLWSIDKHFRSYSEAKMRIYSFTEAVTLYKQMGFITNISPYEKERVTILVNTLLAGKWKYIEWLVPISARLKFDTYLPNKREILKIEAATREEILLIIGALKIQQENLVSYGPLDLLKLYNRDIDSK